MSLSYYALQPGLNITLIFFITPILAIHKEKYPCYEQCANLKVYSKDMEIYVKIE